jgi:predicted small lipoprotein YifL
MPAALIALAALSLAACGDKGASADTASSAAATATSTAKAAAK